MFAFRWTGAALACAIMGFPLMVRAIRALDRSGRRATGGRGATLGATAMARVLHRHRAAGIARHHRRRGARLREALGEFGATITFVSNIPGETQTLSSAIYDLMQVPGGESSVWRLCAVAVAISFAAVFCSEWLVQRQRRGATE